MVHVLQGIATGILFPLYMSNINLKSIWSHVPNIFHAPASPPRGFCHTWHLGPPGHGKRFTAILLLGTASPLRAQQEPGTCRGKVQGETKVIGGKFAALSASPEKQKVKRVFSTIQMTSSVEIIQSELLCDKALCFLS